MCVTFVHGTLRLQPSKVYLGQRHDTGERVFLLEGPLFDIYAVMSPSPRSFGGVYSIHSHHELIHL